jgi:type VI secretion system protein VasD
MPFKPEPTRLGISLNAAATVNVDARGRSMPVVLRAYVLKNAAAFEAADFFSLFERDKQVLGEVMLWREEVALMPGETRRLDVVEVEGGRVVAVFAAFRDIDHAVWRASVPIVANQASQIVVRLQENRVELSTSISILSLPTSVTKPSVPAFSLPPIESPAIPTVPSVPAVPSVSLPTPTIPATSVSTPSLPFSIPVR